MKTALIATLCGTTLLGAELPQFLSAIAHVESRGNPNAVSSDGSSIGIFQIKEIYFKDAVSFNTNLVKYKYSDCNKSNVAVQVVLSYFKKYEKTALSKKDWETLARLHNAGPNWRKKLDKTDKYWQSVRVTINQQ